MTSIIPLTPTIALRAYAAGVFPMAKTREEEDVYWIDPDERGVLPLDDFHISHSLKKTLRKAPFEVRCDTAFAEVLNKCAEPAPNRDETWINEPIEALFLELFDMGLAHSVECWDGDELVGGLYGLALGAAFYGESMFSRRTDASKIALCHLVAIMRANEFMVLDTQFITEHLKQFGAVEIPREEYLLQLYEALQFKPAFHWEGVRADSLFIQDSTQTS